MVTVVVYNGSSIEGFFFETACKLSS